MKFFNQRNIGNDEFLKLLDREFDRVREEIKGFTSRFKYNPSTQSYEVKLRAAVGSVVPGSAIPDGTVIATKLTENVQTFMSDVVFSATDFDTAAWGAGTIKLASGKEYAISASNTGNMTALTYIYFNPRTNNTAFQITTDYASVEGDDTILICVAKPATNVSSGAFFVPAVGVLGVTDINIAAFSITTNMLQASVVTAAKINVAQLSAISADMGSLTAGQVVIGSTNKIWLNDAGDGALNIGGSVKASAPFQIAATGNATIKTSTGTKRIEIRASDNELEFFEGGASVVRIGSDVVGTVDGISIGSGGVLHVLTNNTGSNAAVHAQNSTSGNAFAVFGSAQGNGVNRGIYGEATGGTTNWAGYFDTGNVKIVNNLDCDGTADIAGALAIGNTVNVVSPTSPNRTITIVVGGSTYYLHAKTTND